MGFTSEIIPTGVQIKSQYSTSVARSSGQGRVFVNMQGEPLKGYKHWFDPAVREAGISFFTWYYLRHTFASRLVMAGVDIRTVAELMGHKTIQMTMRYAHLAPEHNLAAVERLASFNTYAAHSNAFLALASTQSEIRTPDETTATGTATT